VDTANIPTAITRKGGKTGFREGLFIDAKVDKLDKYSSDVTILNDGLPVMLHHNT
jgi:hypothetical protein